MSSNFGDFSAINLTHETNQHELRTFFVFQLYIDNYALNRGGSDVVAAKKCSNRLHCCARKTREILLCIIRRKSENTRITIMLSISNLARSSISVENERKFYFKRRITNGGKERCERNNIRAPVMTLYGRWCYYVVVEMRTRHR